MCMPSGLRGRRPLTTFIRVTRGSSGNPPKKPQGVLMTRFNTQLVHGLPVNDNNTGAVNPPIYNSSTYAVESVNAMPRWDYARSGNPTRDFLEKQIAQLEHGTRGFAFASGLAAIHAVLSIFKPGDRIVVGKNIYGGTYSLFNEYFAERGLEFDSVDTADYEALDAAISGRDRGGRAASAVYFETLTNPLLQISNVNRISAIAHRYGALSIVDNTFVTPYLQQPLDLGADIVIHYDPWWNVAVENQATDRAHRIGQKNVVTVYKLIAKGTIEEKIIKLQQMKKELAEEILSGDGIKTASFQREELLELLEERF